MKRMKDVRANECFLTRIWFSCYNTLNDFYKVSLHEDEWWLGIQGLAEFDLERLKEDECDPMDPIAFFAFIPFPPFIGRFAILL